MKRIALITWYNSINYGTCLQCIALSRYLKKRGYNVVVPDKLNYYSIADLGDLFRRVKKKLVSKLCSIHFINNVESVPDYIGKGYIERLKRVNDTIENELDVIQIEKRKDFEKLNDVIDIFLTGSDQIWNPNYLSSAMMLSFVNDEKKKIAYASSIGVDRIPESLVKVYKRYLSRFSYIGVREKSAELELKRYIKNVPIDTVLDPTFLLKKNDYIEMAYKATIPQNIKNSKGYIACYFIGETIDWQSDIVRFAEENNLDIVFCLSESKIIPDQGIIFTEAGPYDFLWILLHGTYVVTDSFHASAISINLNKEVIVYKRFKDEDKNSQNSRIKHLLNMFDMSTRIVSKDNSIFHIANKKIDYNKVNMILQQKRKKSENFIQKILED